ncbi:MAG: hypothetical protein ACYCO3_14900 [Mycobacteriales bacterium]
MYHEHVPGTFDDDELEEVAGTVETSHEVTRRVVVELKPRNDVLERVGDVLISSMATPDGRISTK